MSVKVSDENRLRRDRIVTMRLEGMSYGEIATALNLSRARVAEIVKQALASGDYVAGVTVHSGSNVPLPALATALRRTLNAYGIQSKGQAKETR